MKRNTNKSAKILMCVFAFFILILAFNILYLCVTGKTLVSGVNIRDFAKERGGGQVTTITQATRGTIYTSDNEVVATDVKKYKLYAILSKSRVDANNNPAYVVNKEKTAKGLSEILGISYKTVLNKLKKSSYQVEFGSAGKNLSSITKEKIEKLNLPGLEFEEVTSRNYRFGDFASYEIGYAYVVSETDPYNIVGQMGIEKTYNNWLKGTNGKKVYLEDANHNTLPNGVISETKATAGDDVYLTINSTLQTELDSLLKEMQGSTKAKKACAAIMEAKTGKILAISNYPSYDPNKRNMSTYVDTFLNEAVEPGSVFKSFVYANALSDNVMKISQTYMSGVYNFKVAGRLIKAIRDHNNGVGWGRITFESGFYHSSNTGICHILAEHSNMKSLLQDYKDLGLFQSSTIDGLASGSGVAGYDGKTKSIEYFTTGFGQGSSVTALQLLRGYSTFANDGKTVEPYLVEKVVDPTSGKTVYSGKSSYSKQIFSTSAVKTMRRLMYGVVNKKGSTGYQYHRDDIEIIGKTGTGQVAVNGAYSSTINTHAFVGLAPYDDPEVEVVVWFQNSTGGTRYSAKLVRTIVRSALNIIDASSEKVTSTTYKLDSYKNQSSEYVEELLKKHSVTPIIIGDGETVIDQYPIAKTEVTSSSRVMVLTDGKKIEMPSMTGWSRKDAEAFATLAGVKLDISGVGTIYSQSISKGTVLKDNQTIKVYAK